MNAFFAKIYRMVIYSWVWNLLRHFLHFRTMRFETEQTAAIDVPLRAVGAAIIDGLRCQGVTTTVVDDVSLTTLARNPAEKHHRLTWKFISLLILAFIIGSVSVSALEAKNAVAGSAQQQLATWEVYSITTLIMMISMSVALILVRAFSTFIFVCTKGKRCWKTETILFMLMARARTFLTWATHGMDQKKIDKLDTPEKVGEFARWLMTNQAAEMRHNNKYGEANDLDYQLLLGMARIITLLFLDGNVGTRTFWNMPGIRRRLVDNAHFEAGKREGIEEMRKQAKSDGAAVLADAGGGTNDGEDDPKRGKTFD